jgi:hypothetical protein
MMDDHARSLSDAAFETSAGLAPSLEADSVFTKGALSRGRAAELRQKFSAATPFPHVVIDQLFQPDFLAKVLEDFSVGFGDWVHYNTTNEVKRGTRPNAKLGAGSQRYFDVIHRGQFVQFLSAITGIDGLLPDPSLFGGGLHEIPTGGRFTVHTDFNRHPVTALDNRLVFITYLNKDWDASYGGALELWDAASQTCVSEVVPLFGRSILFAHTPHSLHGHPNPVSAPGGRARRSVAAYFYTNGGPGIEAEETHTTRFLAAPQFGRWGKLVVTANYVSPMLMDGAKMAVRMGSKILRRS